MAIISITDLKNAFAAGDTPSGLDFVNLIDTTFNLPNTATNISTNVTLVSSTSGIPVSVNGETLYIPLFRAI